MTVSARLPDGRRDEVDQKGDDKHQSIKKQLGSTVDDNARTEIKNGKKKLTSIERRLEVDNAIRNSREQDSHEEADQRRAETTVAPWIRHTTQEPK